MHIRHHLQGKVNPDSHNICKKTDETNFVREPRVTSIRLFDNPIERSLSFPAQSTPRVPELQT
jgi:hypothetical protein